MCGCEGRAPKQNPRGKAKKTAMMMPALLPLPTLAFILPWSLFFRVVSRVTEPLTSTYSIYQDFQMSEFALFLFKALLLNHTL